MSDPPHKKSKQQHQQSNSVKVSESTLRAQRFKEKLEKLEKISVNFSKIASQYYFENTTSGYVAFTVQFKPELDLYDLADVITTDPELELITNPNRLRWFRMRQKIVYHMILHCISSAEVRQVITTALPAEKHTGFGAWTALREHYIGDEQAYLESLESKFENFVWEKSESWSSFETRFTSLCSELEIMKVGKTDALKRSRLMKAILESKQCDSNHKPIFDRLNVTSQIHTTAEPANYRKWLLAIRTEAQKIQDEINGRKSVKREREEEHKQKDALAEVSLAEGAPIAQPTGPTRFGKSQITPRSDTSIHPCRNFQRFGTCRFGDKCRFSHAASRGGNGGGFRGPFNRSNSGNNQRGGSNNMPCYEFIATGRCRRGNSCRYKHENPGERRITNIDKETDIMNAEVYTVEFENPQISIADAYSIQPHAHRIIIDSGASQHITSRLDWIHNIRPLKQSILIRGAFGKTTMATQCGDGVIPLGGNKYLSVPNIVYCELVQDTLLSMCLLRKSGHRFDLNRNVCILKNSSVSIPMSEAGNILTFDIPTSQVTKIAEFEVNVTTRAKSKLSESNKPAVIPEKSESIPQQLTTSTSSTTSSTVQQPESTTSNSQLAHFRYGHLCGPKLNELIESNGADGLIVSCKHPSHKDLVPNCLDCALAKAARKLFRGEIEHYASGPNDMLVGDVFGPIITKVKKPDGTVVTSKFYISMLTDVYSRNVSAKIVNSKSEVSDHVISYYHWARIQTGRELKHFHADGGTEYHRAEQVLEMRGVKVTRTPVHTPQHNAIAERKGRTLFEMVRSMLYHAKLDPDLFWFDAFHTAVIIHNRVTIRVPFGKTQYELFTGHKPNLSSFRVFGCDAVVRLPKVDVDGKLGPRGVEGIFVGYDLKREMCYRIRVGNEIIVSRDVKFNELKFSINRARVAEFNRIPAVTDGSVGVDGINRKPAVADNSVGADGIYSIPAGADGNSENDSSSSDDDDEMTDASDAADKRTMNKIAAAERKELLRKRSSDEIGNRRSERTKKRAKRDGVDLDDFGRLALTVDSQPIPTESSSTTSKLPSIRVNEVEIPSTVRAAKRSPWWNYWETAIRAELSSIHDHHTWVLVDPPEGVNLVSCKWVFAVKSKDGFVIRFKARLVARGFSQQYGVDYTETYSPVVKYRTLRILLALIAIQDLTLELMDVQTAYLNAPLKERVYMRQPEGFEQGGPNQVCLLQRALYGLKQSGREWNTHLNEFVLSLGFKRCVSDTCVYVKTSRTGRIMIISIYVDDIPSAYDERDRAEWLEIKQLFFEKYKIKFLGEADWLLNMRITRDRPNRLLWLDQKSYTESFLEEFNMSVGETRSVDHPGSQEDLTQLGCPRTTAEFAEMKRIPYRRVVGLLIYLASTSRPDISYSVNRVAQFSQNPGQIHWRAVIQILRYLCGTSNYGLLFNGQSNSSTAQTALSNTSVSSISVPSVSNSAVTDATKLIVYSDASWGMDKDNRRSTTGWIIKLGNCWIDWNSRKQQTVALSSCEAEYMALGAAAQGALWIKSLLGEMGYGPNSSTTSTPTSSPIPIFYCDNKSAISMAQNNVLHNRSKHIDIKHHFIRELIERKVFRIDWISTSEQVADVLTKKLLPRTFIKFRDLIVVPTGESQF
jgi:hypothetical protein